MIDQTPVVDEQDTNSVSRPSRWMGWLNRENVLVGLLLLLTLWVGAHFRFIGQNWDDFTWLHPDERFLTVNLLPNLGGTLQIVPDDTHYPTHSLLARLGENRFITLSDFVSNTSRFQLGVITDTLSEQAGIGWVGADRVMVYSSIPDAVQALTASEVDAVLLPQIDAQAYVGSHLQSDVMSSQDVHWYYCLYQYPESSGIGGYFDTACSPLNPHNASVGLYVYGTLPLFMAHFAGEAIQTFAPENFQTGTLVWRALSALFDTLTIGLIFLVGARLHNRWTGLLAAILYAAAPLAIQKAHFGTVNSITAFFVMLAILFAVRVQQGGRWPFYIGFGLAVGAAVAGRINTAPLAGLIVLAAMVHAAPVLDARVSWGERRRMLLYSMVGLVLSGIAAFVAFRVFNPYAFNGPGFLGLIPNDRWLADLSAGQYGVSGLQESPPNWQWLARSSYLYPLKDMLLWGMGIALGVLAWVGWVWSGYRLLRGRPAATANILLFVWVLVYFGWLGRLWVMTMRYYLPLYGALALLAAWALIYMVQLARDRGSDVLIVRLLLGLFGVVLAGVSLFSDGSMMVILAVVALLLLLVTVLPLFQKRRALVLVGFVSGFTLLWGMMFTNIYQHQLTRVQASRWQFENIPGDFAMRLEGAPAGTPLINIGIGNRSMDSAENPDALVSYASYYDEGQPLFVTFEPPADGIVSEIISPHLGDPQDDGEDESIYFSISAGLEGEPLASATLTTNLTRTEHVLGNSYTIPLDEPVQLQAGQTYTLKIEVMVGSGPVISSGAVVAVEGPWDDRITTTQICELPGGLTLADDPPSGLNSASNCWGRQSRSALVASYDMFMSLDVDSPLKRDTIINALDVADYIAITSNRFYDPLERNLMRWPMSTRYYDALFDGELGFELVASFDETFEWGPLRFSDQYLPTYDVPQWLNEFEADEAFHVYDHPAVFIFEKNDNFELATAQLILNSVSVNQISGVLDNSTLVGVVNWPTLDADQAPTQLHLTREDWEIQQAGGTWSDRFNSSSMLNTSQPVGMAVWWGVILIFGWVAWPLLFVLFPGLADRGYGLAKIAGLLLVGWLAWLGGSAHMRLWSQSGIIVVLLAVAALSLALTWPRRNEFRAYVATNWKRLLVIEGITLLLFVVFIGVRLTNPDLWHYSKGGEKPMDFTYFNAVLRSTVFPPYDPWYAGGYINYYYFGFVIVGSPVLLLKMVPSFAYNLIIPTLFAVTGISAFSVAFNIVSAWKEHLFSRLSGMKTPARRLGNPWIAGIAALLLCVVLGNLDTIRVIGNGVAQLGGYSRPTGIADFLEDEYRAEHGLTIADSIPEGVALEFLQREQDNALGDRLRYEFHSSWSLVSGLASGFGKLLGGATLPVGTDRWYWGPSRVLAETPGVEGNAITEMPYFTFLYGDLHAHMINLPVLLLILGFLFNEYVLIGQDRRTRVELVLALALGAMAVGMVRAINTWDWPAFLGFSLIAISYFWWVRWRHSFRDLLGAWKWFATLIGLGFITAIVFFIAPQNDLVVDSLIVRLFAALKILCLMGLAGTLGVIAFGWILTRDSFIDFLAYVVPFAVMSFIFVIPYSRGYAAIYSSARLWEGGKTPLWAYFDIHGLFLFLLVSLLIWETFRWLRSVKVKALRGKAIFVYSAMAITGALMLGSLLAAMFNYQVALIVVPLVLWIAALFFRPGQSRPMRYILVLAGFGLALTLGVEVIVIDGDLGRQNTVFKFYMQTWVVFSIMGGAAFAWLFGRSENWSNALRGIWLVPLMVLFVIAAMFPLMATRGRAVDRFSYDVPVTLDGMAYMQYAEHRLMDYNVAIDLEDDYHVIRWLQENVQGTPVIIEGRSLASEYRWNSRISIYTGLPSVLGWNFHQRQQRTLDPLTRLVEQRENNIKVFYNTPDVGIAVDVLRFYDVRYIIVSDMERAQTSQVGLAKFDQMVDMGLIESVYQHGDGVVYTVHQDALDAYVLSEDYQVMR